MSGSDSKKDHPVNVIPIEKPGFDLERIASLRSMATKLYTSKGLSGSKLQEAVDAYVYLKYTNTLGPVETEE